jgi:hypothetical protein
MECYIKDVSGTNTHYMGSIDFNQNFSSLGGNPGSFGYWVMSNTAPGVNWTKVTGYISGFGTSTGQFVAGTKFWTPQALFNYTGGGVSYISGWKVTRLAKGIVGRFPNSTTNSGEAWFGRANDRNRGTYTIQLGGGSASGRTFEVVDYAWSSVMFSVDSGNYASAAGSFRAPIFYDSNNTGYYVDPASTSNVNAMVSYSYQGNGNVGGTGSASWHPSGIYSAGYNWLYGGINAGGSSVTNMGDARANIFYDYNNTGYYLDAASTSVFNRISTVRTDNWLYIDNNYGHSVVGVYSSYRYQGVFAMGDSYKLPADGTSTGSLYGMAWSHPNAGGAAGNLTDHGLLIINNGAFKCAISNSIVASGNITAYSDERLKTNWRNMPKDYVNRLAQVKVGIYDRTDQDDVTQVGVSAQSFQKLLPEAIMTAKDDMQTLSVNYGGAALASTVELAKEVVDLRAKVERLEHLISKLIDV